MSRSGREGRFRRLALVACVCFVGALVAPALASAAPTLVSLTFDDAMGDQYAVRSMLAQRSLHATFYVNSDYVETTSRLTWSQLADLAADGNEIGGHTLDHVNLTTVDSTEATRQVCDDRQTIISHGLTVTDFAYPYGAVNSSVKAIVQGCGYTSARRSWGLCPIADTLDQCAAEQFAKDPSEPVPPPDILATRTIESVRAWNTLDDLERAVTRSEASGGGWVTFVFHHVCDGCDPTSGYSVSPAILSSFLDWLAAGGSSGSTYVRTVRDVVSDGTAPVSAIACNGGSCSGWFNQPVSVSLSATDSGTAVTAIRYTTDGSDPTTSSTVYTGPFTVSTGTTVKYRAWDMAGNIESTESQAIQIDSVAPISSIACNGAPCSSSAYTGAVSVSLSATDTGGSGVAEIHYETNGSDPTLLSPLYAGPFSVTSTTTVKFRAWDKAGNAEPTQAQSIAINTPPPDTTAPTSTIACNGSACSTSWYGPPVSVTLAATDPDDAVAAIRYTTDGSDPTASSTLYGGAFSVSTTTTVKYRAWDTNGNVEATKSQLIQIDTVAPSVSITSPASGATVTGNVKIVASPADAQSGVASVAIYVDGALLGTATSSPWQVPWNTRKASAGQHVLTAVATDRAGNRTTSAAVTITVK